MRISQYFRLGRDQSSLDFVDVDIRKDTKLFIDPSAIRHMPGAWAGECISLLQDFFGTVLEHIRAGRTQAAQNLLMELGEPNETGLGLSRGARRGRGVGEKFAEEIWAALSQSGAAATGLLSDLEDMALFIIGIDKDIVSDITTGIIRGPLISYTQSMSDLYGITMSDGVWSGPIWDLQLHAWTDDLVRLPIANGQKILLVPKVVVRRDITYSMQDYGRSYVIPYLRGLEFRAGSSLVQVLKNGTRRVTARSLYQKYSLGKTELALITRDNPQLLSKYRTEKRDSPVPPVRLEEFANGAAKEPGWDELLQSVTQIAPGPAGASDYHKAVLNLLSALFYPALSFPQKEREIDEGRKRIDIVFTNTADDGFFAWLSRNYTAPMVMVEAKNYSVDVNNPELDQLAGRFSRSRGQVGFVISRTINDKPAFYRRARDAADAGRGYMIGLDDADLLTLVQLRRQRNWDRVFQYLKGHFDKLIM